MSASFVTNHLENKPLIIIYYYYYYYNQEQGWAERHSQGINVLMAPAHMDIGHKNQIWVFFKTIK